MPDYRVTWVIDVEADSPEAAAREALAMQRDRNSTATVFDVQMQAPCPHCRSYVQHKGACPFFFGGQNRAVMRHYQIDLEKVDRQSRVESEV